MNAKNQTQQDTGVARIAKAEAENSPLKAAVADDAQRIGFNADASRRIAEIWGKVKSRHDVVNTG